MMIIWYNENLKAYGLVDIDTNKVSFSSDVVVDEEVGPFHTSPGLKIIEQLVMDKCCGWEIPPMD
jgi:hypothetical protein